MTISVLFVQCNDEIDTSLVSNYIYVHNMHDYKGILYTHTRNMCTYIFAFSYVHSQEQTHTHTYAHKNALTHL